MFSTSGERHRELSTVSTNWKTLSRNLLIKNRFLELWEDKVQQPDGKLATYYVRRQDAFSIIIPFDGNKVHIWSGSTGIPSNRLPWSSRWDIQKDWTRMLQRWPS